jgi:hypothetical protein
MPKLLLPFNILLQLRIPFLNLPLRGRQHIGAGLVPARKARINLATTLIHLINTERWLLTTSFEI